MTPEKLGRIAMSAMIHTSPNIKWDHLPAYIQEDWIRSALAVAATVQREDARICREARNWDDDSRHDDGCIDCSDAIMATIQEGK